MKVYPCPICGQSKNRHGEPMDTPQKTAGHIDGARDDQHNGENGSENMRQIRENESEVDPEEMEQPEQRPASRTPAGNVLDEETIVAESYGNEEMPLKQFLKSVDGSIDAFHRNDKQHDEEIDDLESEIEELREQVSDLEEALNRTLGYVQAMAESEDVDDVLADMDREGFTPRRQL